MTDAKDKIIRRAVALLDANDIAAAMFCAGKGWGDTRDLNAIRAAATDFGASEPVVCAMFGFVAEPGEPRQYVDCFAPGDGRPYLDNHLRPAFYLAVEAFGGKPPVIPATGD